MKIAEYYTKKLDGLKIIGIESSDETAITFESENGIFHFTITLSNVLYKKLSDFKQKNIAKKVRLSTFEDLKPSFYKKHPNLEQYKGTQTVLFRLSSDVGIKGLVVAERVSAGVEHSKKGEAGLQKFGKELLKQRLKEDPDYKPMRVYDGQGNELPLEDAFKF